MLIISEGQIRGATLVAVDANTCDMIWLSIFSLLLLLINSHFVANFLIADGVFQYDGMSGYDDNKGTYKSIYTNKCICISLSDDRWDSMWRVC